MRTELGISIALGAREPIDRIVSIARKAEECGIDAVWVLDSQLLYKDAYMVLAVLARETERLRLGPGVTNLLTRHETVVANAMATLTTIAPGRVLVGVGTGDSSVRPLGLAPLALQEFRRRVDTLKALMRGESVEIGGRSVRLSVIPELPPPVYAAATQPKMLRVAGAVADGVIVLGPADPETVRLQMSHIDAGALEAGRDPREIQRDLWVGLAIGNDEKPFNDVRSYVSTQARLLASWKDLPPSLEPFRSEFSEIVKTYDYEEHLRIRAEHAMKVSDDLVRTLAVAGSIEHCAERVRRLMDLDLARISVTLLPGGRERRLEELNELWTSVRGILPA